jgi:hypothetical protein
MSIECITSCLRDPQRAYEIPQRAKTSFSQSQQTLETCSTHACILTSTFTHSPATKWVGILSSNPTVRGWEGGTWPWPAGDHDLRRCTDSSSIQGAVVAESRTLPNIIVLNTERADGGPGSRFGLSDRLDIRIFTSWNPVAGRW